ncbi:YceI family protein [Dyella sp.]|uniref:YceI family protein n=1 Tax=Dyella sp. TaxID=1869338 RepID=UPI002ECFFD33
MKPIVRALFPLLLTATVPGLVQATDYTVQPGSSKLGFTSNFQGQSFDGSFGTWKAAISYDAAKLASSRFDVEVDLSSVKTGDKDRDGALPGSDFFDIAKFPKAHFVTTAFHQNGDKVVADGNLTLRGVTKPVSLNVTFVPQGSGATLDVTGSIKRLDFGIGSGDYADTSVIGPDVKVNAHLVLVGK